MGATIIIVWSGAVMKLHKTAQRSAEEKFHLLSTIMLLAVFLSLPAFDITEVRNEILIVIALAYVVANAYVDYRSKKGLSPERLLEYCILAAMFIFVISIVN